MRIVNAAASSGFVRTAPLPALEDKVRWGAMIELDGLYVDHVAALERAYAEILTEQKWDCVAISSGGLVKRTEFDDQFWPLRASPPWQHWLPLAEPEGVLVLRPGRRPKLVRVVQRGFWEKAAPPESDVFLTRFDVVGTSNPAEAKQHVGAGRVAWVGELRGAGAAPDAACINPPALVRALDALRVQKTPYEVACIAEANRRAWAGHEALREAFLAGDETELDLHLLYLRTTAQDDGETPYKNIVALGANAATLHHVAYGRCAVRREAETLLVDAGATCRGYGADITRTWIKGTGSAAAAFAELIAGVDRLQRRLCASVRVGSPYEDLHDESHRGVASVLRDVGLVRGSVDEAVARGVTRAFYPHGLGHSLGLQTHDVGCARRPARADNAFLRNTTDVAVGQVFTIEPGVYFIDDLLEPLRSGPAAALVDWNTVLALSPLGGVRIEDDLHVLGGERIVRNLTRFC